MVATVADEGLGEFAELLLLAHSGRVNRYYYYELMYDRKCRINIITSYQGPMQKNKQSGDGASERDVRMIR